MKCKSLDGSIRITNICQQYLLKQGKNSLNLSELLPIEFYIFDGASDLLAHEIDIEFNSRTKKVNKL